MRRRVVAVAAAAGAVTSLIVASPLAFHLRSAVLDDGSYDAFQFLWNLWWVRESLTRLHTDPFLTHALFFPDGVPLLFHTFSFTLGLASLPLQAFAGLVGAHNLLVLAGPALTLLAVTLLAYDVTEDLPAAVAGGLVAAVNPIAIWFLPVLYLDCTYLIAFLLLAWRTLHRRRRAQDVAWCLAILLATIFASQEYALMTLALLALDTSCRLLLPERSGTGRAWMAGTLAFWGLAGVGLAALAVVALSSPAATPPRLQLLLGSGYALGLVTPPWWQAPVVRFWSILYLGTAPLLLLPLVLRHGGRRAAYWLLAALATALMALGPYLHLHHPYPDLRLPSEAVLTAAPRGPYFLAMQIVPLLRFFRAPYRWIVPAEVMLAVASAAGIAGLRAALVPARRHVATAVILLLVAAGAALDVHGLRAPMVPVGVPALYATLRDDPGPGAVLELPSGLVAGQFAAFSSLFMYWQTTHRRPLLEGTVARLPPGRRVVIERDAAELAALPYVKYVVVHRDLLPAAYPASREQTARIEAAIRPHAAVVAESRAMTVYRLGTFVPASTPPLSPN